MRWKLHFSGEKLHFCGDHCWVVLPSIFCPYNIIKLNCSTDIFWTKLIHNVFIEQPFKIRQKTKPLFYPYRRTIEMSETERWSRDNWLKSKLHIIVGISNISLISFSLVSKQKCRCFSFFIWFHISSSIVIIVETFHTCFTFWIAGQVGSYRLMLSTGLIDDFTSTIHAAKLFWT